jgi:hypothetical protein
VACCCLVLIVRYLNPLKDIEKEKTGNRQISECNDVQVYRFFPKSNAQSFGVRNFKSIKSKTCAENFLCLFGSCSERGRRENDFTKLITIRAGGCKQYRFCRTIHLFCSPFRLLFLFSLFGLYRIFHERMYHNTAPVERGRTQKNESRGKLRERKISLMATQIFCLLFFLSIIFFFCFLCVLFTDDFSRLTDRDRDRF